MYEINNVAYALPQAGDGALEAFPGAWREKRIGRDEALDGMLIENFFARANITSSWHLMHQAFSEKKPADKSGLKSIF